MYKGGLQNYWKYAYVILECYRLLWKEQPPCLPIIIVIYLLNIRESLI